jgi:hypothetical protein
MNSEIENQVSSGEFNNKRSKKKILIILGVIIALLIVLISLLICYKKGIIFKKESDTPKATKSSVNKNSESELKIEDLVGTYTIGEKKNAIDASTCTDDYDVLVLNENNTGYHKHITCRGSSWINEGKIELKDNKLYLYDDNCNEEMLVDGATCSDPADIFNIKDKKIYYNNIMYNKSADILTDEKEEIKVSNIVEIKNEDLINYDGNQLDENKTYNIKNHSFKYNIYNEDTIDDNIHVRDVDVTVDDTINIKKIEWTSLGTDPWTNIYISDYYYVVLKGEEADLKTDLIIYDNKGKEVKKYHINCVCNIKIKDNYLLVREIRNLQNAKNNNYNFVTVQIDISKPELEVNEIDNQYNKVDNPLLEQYCEL